MEMRAMILGAFCKPALGNLARALLPTPFKHVAALSRPCCDDCRLPAVFRTELLDARLHRQVRVHQCPNCAKIIWGGE